MTPTRQGSLRLFRLWGIDVHVHWSWFVVAVYSVSTRVPNYVSPVWALLEYLALFVVVLLHEFGHALACRQVGGQADQIVLWPLGGVAYVAPPARPGRPCGASRRVRWSMSCSSRFSWASSSRFAPRARSRPIRICTCSCRPSSG
ncbi:M50 family metallopeptidase [Lacunisphaera limnophila]|uniref:M50 family metallopeptidase n=1 Tax=Lacunisphaera limnophila TaxID=1838286 RepID=UPI0012FD7F8E